MKVLIINPPSQFKVIEHPDQYGNSYLESDDYGDFPPLGSLYVLTHLDTKLPQHQTYFIDCIAEKVSHEDLKGRIRDIRPDIVGITSFTISLVDVCTAARNIREVLPDVHLCLGGHHPIAFPFEAARLPEFDSVVVGEGEVVFTELVDALDKGYDFTTIQGVYTAKSIEEHRDRQFKDKRFLARVMVEPAYIEDIDSLPIVNRKYIRHLQYHNILGVTDNLATILSSRGCPYLCTFCDVPYKRYRPRDNDLVLDEVEECLEMGYTEFRFYDDLFNINHQKVMDFCEAIERRKLKFTWDFRGRVNGVTYESLRKAKQNGLRMIAFGVETGTDEGLRALKKGTKIEKVAAAFQWSRELGILTVADFIIGLPWEKNEQDVTRSTDFLIKLDPDYAQISILTLYPNTALYDQAINAGMVEKGRWEKWIMDPQEGFVVDHWEEHMNVHELARLQKKAYRKFYYRPRYILRSAINTKSFYEFASKASGAFKLMQVNTQLNKRVA